MTGPFYPAWTGACCLAERILNDLILRLREDFKASPRYKEIGRRDSFENWNHLLDILTEWKILDAATVPPFDKLLRLRKLGAVHYGDVSDKAAHATEALEALNAVVRGRFGIGTAPFFMCRGEIYVRASFEEDSFTKAFIIPYCHPLSYTHRIEGQYPDLVVADDQSPAEKGEITDERFCDLRTAWREQTVDPAGRSE